EPLFEQLLGDVPTDDLTPREHGLQVHRLPHGTRLNIRSLKRKTDVLTCRAESVRVDRERRQPPCVAPPGRLRHELDTLQVAKGLLIEIEVRTPGGHSVLENLELTEPDASEHVAQTVVVADLGVLVVG